MKKVITLLILTVIVIGHAKSADDPYRENLLNAKTLADTATTEESLISAANYFIRIAGMNPGQWLPHYYAAYCYTIISHMNHEEGICDKWVDRAQEEVEKAFAIAPENAEVLVMKGFVVQARMRINPMVRGFQLFDESMKYFNQATEIDPANPRAYLWKGVNLLNTPETFGGGKQSGCPLIKEAIAKYESFKATDAVDPVWGYSYAREMLKSCQ